MMPLQNLKFLSNGRGVIKRGEEAGVKVTPSLSFRIAQAYLAKHKVKYDSVSPETTIDRSNDYNETVHSFFKTRKQTQQPQKLQSHRTIAVMNRDLIRDFNPIAPTLRK
jgi:hypothetical protein